MASPKGHASFGSRALPPRKVGAATEWQESYARDMPASGQAHWPALSRLTYTAFTASVLASEALWFWVFVPNPVEDAVIAAGELQANISVLTSLVLVAFVVAAIDIWAGFKGGPDRRVSTIAGLILLSPLVGTLISFVLPY